MKQNDNIRIVWRQSPAGARPTTEAPAPPAASPAQLPAEPPAQRRALLSRSRRLWGREDGFTMSAGR